MAIVSADLNEEENPGLSQPNAQAGIQTPQPGVSATGITSNLTPSPQTGGGAGGLIGGAGGAPTGTTPVGGQPGSTGLASTGGTPTSSGMFAGINNYITGNQGNEGQLASNVNNFITDQANTASNVLNNQVNDFTSNVNKGTVWTDPNLLSQEAQDPTKFSGDANNVANYQNQEQGTYKGPNSFTNSQWQASAQAPINQYDQYVTALSNPNQYGTVLQAINQGNPYTSGQQNLDRLLLQNSPEARSTIQNTVGKLGNLDEMLSTAANQGDNAVKSALTTTQNTNQTAQKQIQNQEQNLSTDISNQVSQLQNTNQQQQTAIQNALNTNQNLNENQLKLLGITPAQWNNLQGNISTYNKTYGPSYGNMNNLSGYFVPTTAQITANNAASPEQYARLAALNKLAGSNLPANNFISNAAEAGTAPSQVGSFNYQQALNDIASASSTNASQNSSNAANASANYHASKAAKQSGLNTALQVVGTIATVASAC